MEGEDLEESVKTQGRQMDLLTNNNCIPSVEKNNSVLRRDKMLRWDERIKVVMSC